MFKGLRVLLIVWGIVLVLMLASCGNRSSIDQETRRVYSQGEVDAMLAPYVDEVEHLNNVVDGQYSYITDLEHDLLNQDVSIVEVCHEVPNRALRKKVRQLKRKVKRLKKRLNKGSEV